MIWGDTAIFINPTDPNNCILTNRFKRGERVGFRMTAIDGGTGEVEQTAALVAHVTYAGKTVDAPMRWRGDGGSEGPGAARLCAFAVRALDRIVDRPGRCADWPHQLHRDGDRQVREKGDVHAVLRRSLATRHRPLRR